MMCEGRAQLGPLDHICWTRHPRPIWSLGLGILAGQRANQARALAWFLAKGVTGSPQIHFLLVLQLCSFRDDLALDQFTAPVPILHHCAAAVPVE
jgi:hypothetical protein